MARAVVVVLAGVVVGSALAALVHGGSGTESAGTPGAILVPEASDQPVVAAVSLSVSAPGQFDAGLQAAQANAAIENFFDVEDELIRAAGEPPSSARDAEIAALLEQFALFDPREAVLLAERLDLDSRHIDKLFRDWAGDEPDAALQGLLLLRSNPVRRSASLALLDIFGYNEAATERIAAVFPRVESRAFTVDAISKRAEFDFVGAIEAAQAYVGWNFVPLSRVADVAARMNPEFGIENSEHIKVAMMRRRFRDRLMDEWAKLDPAAMLGWLETADLSEQTQAVYAFQAAAAYAPDRLLEIAGNFGPAQAQVIRGAAVRELMLLDPMTAFDTINALPPTPDTDSLINSIAGQFAMESPYEAMAWVQSLEPRSQVAFNAVLSRVASTDPMLAIDAVITEILDPVASSRGEMPPLSNVLSSAMNSANPSELMRVIDTIATHPDTRVSNQIENVIVRWANSDPKGATDWVLRGGTDITLPTMENLAAQVANRDPDLAMQTMAQLPRDRRGPWIVGAATGIAVNDFDQAMAFVGRYRSDPVYESALSNVLQRGASTNPAVVARFIETEAPAQANNLAVNVAGSWARQDPKAAADWLTGLADIEAPARNSALNNVASAWAASDQRAARRWVLDLGEGTARDAGLTGFINGSSSSGSFDRQLLNMYSSDSARSEGVVSAMFALGRTDPELGRSLIDEYISDPTQRQLAEQRLDQGASSSSQVIYLPNGNMIMLQ